MKYNAASLPVLRSRRASELNGRVDDLGFRRATARWVDASDTCRRVDLLSLVQMIPSLTTKRFIEEYASAVLGRNPQRLRAIEIAACRAEGVKRDRLLSDEALADVIARYLDELHGFPRSVADQLHKAGAFEREDCDLEIHRVYDTDDHGYGGAGFLQGFDPQTGAAQLTLDFSPSLTLPEISAGRPGLRLDLATFRRRVGDAYRVLVGHIDPTTPERHAFVIVGRTVMLGDAQQASLPRQALLNMAAHDSIARRRLDATSIAAPAGGRLSTRAGDAIGRGTGASAGVVSGAVTTSQAHVEARRPSIFVATTPGPHNVAPALAADAAVFGTGGLTSHIAVITRGAGKPCVMGVSGLTVTSDGDVRFGDRTVRQGDLITVNGSTGEIYLGDFAVPCASIEDVPIVHLLDACDKSASVAVYANADNVGEAGAAFAAGARGIGLCRIEHLLAHSQAVSSLRAVLRSAFNLAPQIDALRVAEADLTRYGATAGTVGAVSQARAALEGCAEYATYYDGCCAIGAEVESQITDILRLAGHRPVTIRLLDAPLHEFLTAADIAEHPHALTDAMLGMRGIRLLLAVPALAEVQIRAIASAAELAGRVAPTDIMIPMMSEAAEVRLLRAIAAPLLDNTPGPMRVGAMIETPRAALIAVSLAELIDFASFGTNDLTQFTWAISRDNAGLFLERAAYRADAIDPYRRLDADGVGALIAMAVRAIRSVKPMSIGICGELANDAEAVRFFHSLGVDYISTSPTGVRGARFIAGQLS